MKKLGKAVVLSCTLAVIMGLALPAISQAKNSHNRREGHRSKKGSQSRYKRHDDSYKHRGRDSYTHRERGCYRPYSYPAYYSRRTCTVRSWPSWGSFCFWTPDWGFGGSF